MENDLEKADSTLDSAVETKLCLNCKKQIASTNFMMHEVHCLRNIKLCTHCNEPVAKQEIDQHIEELHTTSTCPSCMISITKAELEHHIADVHSTTSCPECGQEVVNSEFEEHKRALHGPIVCPRCKDVVSKSALDKHHKTDCNERRDPCQYCSMLVSHSKHEDHEDYCGTRTEPCEKCGRFIMVRDTDIHQQTNCEYPAVASKNDHKSSSASEFDWERHVGLQDRFEVFHPGGHLHGRVPEFGNRRLEDVFGRDGFRGSRFRGSSRRDPFCENVPLVLGSSPPPYWSHNFGMTNNDRTDVRERHISPTENIIELDDDDDDDDDDDACIPCEFCKKLFLANKLLMHQNRCPLANFGHEIDGQDHKPLNRDRELERIQPETDEPLDVKYPISEDCPDIVRLSPEELIDVDSLSDDVAETETVLVDDGAKDNQSLIPCEICLELVDFSSLDKHQEECYRQQTSALQAFHDTDNDDAIDTARRYRFPYSIMSMEERERFGGGDD